MQRACIYRHSAPFNNTETGGIYAHRIVVGERECQNSKQLFSNPLVVMRPKSGGEIRVDFETRKIQATFSDGVRKEYDNLTEKEISGLMKADVVQVVFKLDHPNDPAFKKEDPANKHRWNWRF